jgi:hypothetical protein
MTTALGLHQSEIKPCSLPYSSQEINNINDNKPFYTHSFDNNLVKEYSGLFCGKNRNRPRLMNSNPLGLMSRNVHTSAVYLIDRTPMDPDDPDYEPPWKEKPAAFRLSSWPVIIWPSLVKTMKNWFLTFLIKGYMDEAYSSKGFLDGAEQVCMGNGKVLSKAIKNNCLHMSLDLS